MQLVVVGSQVDHQTGVYVSERETDERRQHPQRAFLRGARGKSRRSLQRLVAGVEQKPNVGFRQQRRVRPVGDGDDECSGAPGGLRARQRERRRTAGGDGDDSVAPEIAERRDGLFRRLGVVFRGGVEVEGSAVAAGEDNGDPSAVEAKGAGQFGGVFRRDEAGRARAQINAAAAALPSNGQTRRRRADVAFDRRNAGDRPPIGREHRAGERWRRVGDHARSGVAPSLSARFPQFHAAHHWVYQW